MILYILHKENKAPYPHFFDNLDNEKNRDALSSTEEPPSLVDKRKVCHKLPERNMERRVEEWTDTQRLYVERDFSIYLSRNWFYRCIQRKTIWSVSNHFKVIQTS